MTILDRRPGVLVPRADGRLAALLGEATVVEDPLTGVITVRVPDLPCPVLIDEAEAHRAAAGLANLIAARLTEARAAHAAELADHAVDVELAGRRPTIATARLDGLGWE